MSRITAATVACLAVYGPFVAMSFYTLLFVSCSHCKLATWQLLPCAPGLLPFDAGRRLLDLPPPANAFSFIGAFVISITAVIALAYLIRRGRLARIVIVALAFIVFSVFAFCTLAMIRA